MNPQLVMFSERVDITCYRPSRHLIPHIRHDLHAFCMGRALELTADENVMTRSSDENARMTVRKQLNASSLLPPRYLLAAVVHRSY